MKYSIIIVAYKDSDALVRCLESLDKNIPEDKPNDAEIVIVDNSPEPIQGAVTNDLLLRLCQKYLRVLFLWNDGENKGFSAAVNQGVKESHGKNIVLINPDCVVFPEWAERMERFLQVEKVAAVGPISNFVAGFQNAFIHMQPQGEKQDDWEATAKMARRGLDRRGVNTKLLIGFFLMMRRKVWDEVGGLDPALFLGCDDLDLSLRLTDMGYTLVIASDVFVYHEGHTSMHKGGSKSEEYIKASENTLMKKLEAKYGQDMIPSSTDLWGCEILPTHSMRPMTLSVSMIVRDEEKNLHELLPQLWFVDELVIVDTKPDRRYHPSAEQIENSVVAIAPHLEGKVKVGFFPWNDHFADARNYSLKMCTKDYVLWLDADDRVPEMTGKYIRAALDYPGPLTAYKKCHFALMLEDMSPAGNGQIQHPRIFPNLPGIHWAGRVHEQYAPSAELWGLKLVPLNAPIIHTGYMDQEVKTAKSLRNIRLLEMEPDSPYKFYQIGKSYTAMGEWGKARDVWVKYLRHHRVFALSLTAEQMGKDMEDQMRYLIALSYYQEAKKAVPEMDDHLKDNSKADAMFYRAERLLASGTEKLKAGEAVEGSKDYMEAFKLYAQYLSLGAFGDYFGTDREILQPLCQQRMEMIEGAKVKAEDSQAVAA